LTVAQRLTFANNYTATAASGVSGFNDYIDVDLLPSDLDGDLDPTVSRGYINIPITIEWEDTGVTYREETICTGWTDTPSKQLYINTMYGSSTNGNSATIRCAPNRQVMECFQLAQSVNASVGAAETYQAENGIAHTLSIDGACTISIEDAFDSNGAPFDNYTTVYNGGHVTRLILIDANVNQPALTWTTWWSATINWENGSPQFTAGKTVLIVELFGLYGSFKLFA